MTRSRLASILAVALVDATLVWLAPAGIGSATASDPGLQPPANLSGVDRLDPAPDTAARRPASADCFDTGPCPGDENAAVGDGSWADDGDDQGWSYPYDEYGDEDAYESTGDEDGWDGGDYGYDYEDGSDDQESYGESYGEEEDWEDEYESSYDDDETSESAAEDAPVDADDGGWTYSYDDYDDEDAYESTGDEDGWDGDDYGYDYEDGSDDQESYGESYGEEEDWEDEYESSYDDDETSESAAEDAPVDADDGGWTYSYDDYDDEDAYESTGDEDGWDGDDYDYGYEDSSDEEASGDESYGESDGDEDYWGEEDVWEDEYETSYYGDDEFDETDESTAEDAPVDADDEGWSYPYDDYDDEDAYESTGDEDGWDGDDYGYGYEDFGDEEASGDESYGESDGEEDYWGEEDGWEDEYETPYDTGDEYDEYDESMYEGYSDAYPDEASAYPADETADVAERSLGEGWGKGEVADGLELFSQPPAELLLPADQQMLRTLERLGDEPSGVRRARLNDYIEGLGWEAVDFVSCFQDVTGIEAFGLADDLPRAAALLATFRLVQEGELGMDQGVEVLRRTLKDVTLDWIEGVDEMAAGAYETWHAPLAGPAAGRSHGVAGAENPVVEIVVSMATRTLGGLGGSILDIARQLSKLGWEPARQASVPARAASHAGAVEGPRTR